MLSIGSIIYSDSQGEFLSREAITEIRNNPNSNELFNIAWMGLINPWIHSAYATLNLSTGEFEGNGEFSMHPGTPYLILFKVNLELLIPDNILTAEEVEEYEKLEESLELFCNRYAINVKQRANHYYCSYWDRFSWYWDSIINESVTQWSENRKSA